MGIVSVKDGIVKQLRRDNVSKGVNVRFDENGDIVIELHIVVAYGVSIKAVTDNLMQSVKYKVEDLRRLRSAISMSMLKMLKYLISLEDRVK